MSLSRRQVGKPPYFLLTAISIDKAANAITPIASAKVNLLSNEAIKLKIANPPITGTNLAAVDGLRGAGLFIAKENRTPVKLRQPLLIGLQRQIRAEDGLAQFDITSSFPLSSIQRTFPE